jgi:hypothetical protein
MNAKLLSTIAAASFAATTVMAAEPETATAAKPAVEPYQLKKRSVCNLPADARPPFWPIGWVHRDGPHVEAPIGPKYVLDEKNFAVTSILMGPPAIAFINGRAYEEGQFLRFKAPSQTGAPTTPAATPAPATLRIRVHRITDGQVWLSCESQIITVPLKRPELNEHKAGQELLNEEKDDVVPSPAPAPAVSKR